MFLISRKPIYSPVLVVDALGISSKVDRADTHELESLVRKLESQFYKFRAKIPHRLLITAPEFVWGTGEFSTLQINDMFTVFSERVHADIVFRHLVTASLLYQTLLLEGFIPRGGLGYGLIFRKKNMLLGSGFMDAYKAAEKRDRNIKNICAIRISNSLLAKMPDSIRAYKLLCYYQESYFLNPGFLIDPEMGKLDHPRIIKLLEAAGTNREKLDATTRFLENLEDFDKAMMPNSKAWKYTRSLAKKMRR